jgi:hypothetical protein
MDKLSLKMKQVEDNLSSKKKKKKKVEDNLVGID